MNKKVNHLKRPIQRVSFSSIEEVLEFIPSDELKLTEFFRDLIFKCVPDIKEKLSFNVPYYYRNRGMFFIWPASILWGKKQTYTGVRFGFQQGYLLADETNYLDKGNRKLVFWKDYNEIKKIDKELLTAYIFESRVIDDEFKKKKKQ